MLMALPAAVFYLLLWKNAVSIPILDDYDIILSSLNRIQRHEVSRMGLLFVSGHNGYKLMFENAVVLAQFSLFGRAQFLPLVAFGNAFALFIFAVIAAMSRAVPGDLAKRCALLVPVAFLLFQLQYASALDFASSSLQHMAVVFFALLSICLLDRRSETAFWCACGALALSIGSLPNGFFAAPVGFLLLAQSKAWRRTGMWVATTVAMLALYLFRY